MTDKEAMKLALDALETECDIYREHDEDGAPEYILETIAALKERLAQPAPVQQPFEDLATELFVVAQISPADDGFSDTINRIETWLREHFLTPPQRTEQEENKHERV